MEREKARRLIDLANGGMWSVCQRSEMIKTYEDDCKDALRKESEKILRELSIKDHEKLGMKKPKGEICGIPYY